MESCCFPSARFSDNAKFMSKSISVNKKSRGRPVSTGTGQLVGVRMLPDQLAQVDAWAVKQPDKPGRPEAVRRLVATALKADK